MTESGRLLQHSLAALAYRTQKALRGAPDEFGEFRAAPTARTQLAFLRRLHGTPVPSENFIFATIDASRVGSDQALPNAPDVEWRAEDMPHAPGSRRRRRDASQ